MPFDVKRLDIYRKVPKDLTQPTVLGAVISVACMLFMSFLFISEFLRFLSVEIVSELYVDESGTTEGRIPVIINITTPHLACEFVGLDIQDEMGRHEVGFVEDTSKVPLDNGCKFEAKFFVNKVPGNFHLSTHSAAQQPVNPDMRHVIHTVAFGQDVTHKTTIGTFNALKERTTTDSSPLNSHDYILKIVPTIYESLDGHKVYSYQYTYAHKEYISYHHSGQVIPAVWFRYDLSPITVKYTEHRQPFYTFLTTVCAIVGGTFTVAGLIDSIVFTASEFYKKFELGKLS